MQSLSKLEGAFSSANDREMRPPMRIALCNEVLRDLRFDRQCDLAARLGYDGLEVAPFTLGETPHRLAASARRRLRRQAEDAGIGVIGLHYLLLAPSGLSITSRDPATRARTVEVIRGLVGLCADLGGRVMVHGSPAQRRIPPGDDPAEARGRAMEVLAQAAEAAAAAEIIYCLEPLPASQTEFVNRLEDAAALVDAIGNPALRIMLDTCSASESEAQPPAALAARWLPTGKLAHIQVNDANQRAPGQGDTQFAQLFRVLLLGEYDGAVSVEPFRYEPDGPTTAARAIGYIRGLLEALETR